jgi:hypothetical protein
MDEIEIEAFRADTRASKGITADHIAEAASAYDPEGSPAPLVFGHPTHDSPALGIIAGARAEGNKLFLRIKNIAEQVREAVAQRRIINRSVAFWSPDHPSNPTPGKYAIRHLGLLGGMAPAIPGMAALRFSADEERLESEEDTPPEAALVFRAEAEGGTPIVEITEPRPPKEQTMNEQEIQAAREANEAEAKRLADEKAALERDRATFAAEATARREATNKATVDGLVSEGKLLPAEADDMVKVFNALPVDALTFSAGDQLPAAVLGAFLTKLPKRVPVGESTAAPATEFSAADDAKVAAEKALAAANAKISRAYQSA